MVGQGFDESNLWGEIELVDERPNPRHLDLAVGPTRSSDHEQRRVTASQRLERTERDVDALQGLDASDEQQNLSCWTDSQD